MIVLKIDKDYVKIRQQDATLVSNLQEATTFQSITYKDNQLIKRDINKEYSKIEVKIECV